MENTINLQEFYTRLDSIFQEKNIDRTKGFLEDQLKIAEGSGDLAATVVICNELGGILRVTGKIDDAIELYKKILAALTEMDMLHTEQHATVLINTGDVYISARDWEPALDYFSRAREMLIKLDLDQDYRMAALCNNISSVYREIERFEEAELALGTAFDIIRNIPECRGELATTYVNLGELQVRQNKLDMAKESFLNATEIFEEASGDKDVHYSVALAGLGEICYLTKDYEQAEGYLERALGLIERDFGRTASYDVVSNNLEAVRKEKND